LPDELKVIRGATSPTESDGSAKFIAGRNRARMGLLPHSEAFTKFLADQAKHSLDLKRPMIGDAVSDYRVWPNLEGDYL
jgi:hypothetical protein